MIKLTEEQIEEAFQQAAGADEETHIRFARAIEAEVLRLNGIGEGERSYACDHDDAVHCSNCYAVTPQQAAPVPDGWISVEQQMPKSGQIVLALQKWDHSGKLGIIRAAWLAAKTEESSPESDIGEYDEATDTYYEPEGWYEQISHWDEYSAAGVSGAIIVAWMPLPAAMLSAAPKVQETGA